MYWRGPEHPPPEERSLGVSTLGEAHDLGWRITVRCDAGKQNGMKRRRECNASIDLDMETMVWTRGRNFPLAMLWVRLACLRCGSRHVRIMLHPPAVPNKQRARA